MLHAFSVPYRLNSRIQTEKASSSRTAQNEKYAALICYDEGDKRVQQPASDVIQVQSALQVKPCETFGLAHRRARSHRAKRLWIARYLHHACAPVEP